MELKMDDARKDLGMVSSVLSTGAAVVLPPGIVQAAVAPVIVLEVLFTTVVGSIQSMAAPLLALLAAVLYFVWRETRRTTPEEAAT